MSRSDCKDRKSRSQIGEISWARLASRPSTPNGKSKSLTIVDLFCGCGGLTLGVWEAARRHRRQLQIRLAVDESPAAMAVYSRNFEGIPSRFRVDDVTRLFPGQPYSPMSPVERYWSSRIGTLDLVVAGPPCQGHSDLNNSTRREDPRNALYLRVMRAAELLRPKVVIVENVPAIRHDRNDVVLRAESWLTALGYRVTTGVVSLADFGLPQSRKRHFLIALLSGHFQFDELKPTTVRPANAGIFLAGLEDEPVRRAGLFYQPSRVTAENQRRIDYLFKHNLNDLPNKLRPSCHSDKQHAYVSMYGRMHWDKPAQTITSGFGSMGQGRYVHPRRKRLLTPHEAARLQGFPDFFDFSPVQTLGALRSMIANAVPPQFIAVVISRLISNSTL